MIDVISLHDMVDNRDADGIRSGSWTAAQLNARNEAGLTPVMLAAQNGDYYCAQALKDAGADLDLTDSEGRKAVDIAAKNGHSLIIVCLIKGGCGG